MDSFWKEMFMVYGPLALGWPMFFYMFRANNATNEKVLNAFMNDTEAKVELKNAMEALADIIKAGTNTR